MLSGVIFVYLGHGHACRWHPFLVIACVVSRVFYEHQDPIIIKKCAVFRCLETERVPCPVFLIIFKPGRFCSRQGGEQDGLDANTTPVPPDTSCFRFPLPFPKYSCRACLQRFSYTNDSLCWGVFLALRLSEQCLAIHISDRPTDLRYHSRCPALGLPNLNESSTQQAIYSKDQIPIPHPLLVV